MNKEERIKEIKKLYREELVEESNLKLFHVKIDCMYGITFEDILVAENEDIAFGMAEESILMIKSGDLSLELMQEVN